MDRKNRVQLRRLDWKRIYGDVPAEVCDGVQLAFARIHAREKRKRRILRTCAACAAALMLLGAGALALRGLDARENSPDRIARPQAPEQVLTLDAAVYASKEDPCFHLYKNCSQMLGQEVELKLVTALEFEKKLCPACGAGMVLP